MTEQQPYRVVARQRGFELRRYPAHLAAEVRVEGSFSSTVDEAFRALAGYIGGANRARRGGVANAAVEPLPADSRKIAMTSPVLQEEGERPGAYLVRFVMPAGSTAESLPEPDDPRVVVREMPEQLAAAVRFSGRWTQRAFDERATVLGRAVTAAGLTPSGGVRYARFDPPWKPWFLRRNEVVLPVVE
ncbi:SOUL family heme-binding protein [Micromonospora sp. DT233]|uniref:SOUL family heme-binding protein n=1 Tax=Micromonospora sp. DT233 TaxID=3393432 RepID=UPI003CE74C90